VRAAIAIVMAALVAVPVASAYKNPTPGRELVLQIPGMHRAKVRRNIVYAPRLKLDVYRPRKAKGPLPAVLFGGPGGVGKDSGQKIGWAQLISASGMAAVAFDIRTDHALTTPDPATRDVARAISYVRSHAARLGVDPNRLCTLGFSLGTAPWHLAATMRDPQPWLRCNVVYYGQLDFDDPDLAEFSALTHLRRNAARIPAMLVVKAGLDNNEGLNESIDRFAAAAAEVHADVRVITHPSARHAFDIGPRTSLTRSIIRETLRYMKARLAKPLRFDHDCLSDAERGGVVRFFASDDTRLIGAELGSGPRGVIFGHQGGGAPASLCSWMPYGRHLAAAGYHVLAIDHRAFGSSGSSPVPANLRRVDFDILAAVDLLRRHGATTVVLGGASLGGAAVLAAAPHVDPPVQGVISVAAPDRFVSVDAIGAVRISTIPSLFVSAAQDDPFAQQAQEFYDASPAADKKLLIVPGIEHGAPVLEQPETAASVDAWIAAHSR
jgi:dienelactone hydrolase